MTRLRGLAALDSNAPVEIRSVAVPDGLAAFLSKARVEVAAVAISHGLPSMFGVF